MTYECHNFSTTRKKEDAGEKTRRMRDVVNKKEKNLKCRGAARYYFQLSESRLRPMIAARKERFTWQERPITVIYPRSRIYATTNEIYIYRALTNERLMKSDASVNQHVGIFASEKYEKRDRDDSTNVVSENSTEKIYVLMCRERCNGYWVTH